RGGEGREVGLRLERVGDRRRVLGDEVVQRQDEALVAVAEQLGLRELRRPRHEHVRLRQVAARERDLPRLGRRGRVVARRLELDVDVELLLAQQRERVGVEVHLAALRAEDGDDALVLLGVRARAGGEREGERRHGGGGDDRAPTSLV